MEERRGGKCTHRTLDDADKVDTRCSTAMAAAMGAKPGVMDHLVEGPVCQEFGLY